MKIECVLRRLNSLKNYFVIVIHTDIYVHRDNVTSALNKYNNGYRGCAEI